MMKWLDANYVLRFILQDNAEMAATVKNVILSCKVFVSDPVLAEVVYVLTKVYRIDRKIIADTVLKFTEIQNVQTNNQSVIRICMQYYAKVSLDFVDCLLAAYHKVEGHEILSFDKKLTKLIERIDTT